MRLGVIFRVEGWLKDSGQKRHRCLRLRQEGGQVPGRERVSLLEAPGKISCRGIPPASSSGGRVESPVSGSTAGSAHTSVCVFAGEYRGPPVFIQTHSHFLLDSASSSSHQPSLRFGWPPDLFRPMQCAQTPGSFSEVWAQERPFLFRILCVRVSKGWPKQPASCHPRLASLVPRGQGQLLLSLFQCQRKKKEYCVICKNYRKFHEILVFIHKLLLAHSHDPLLLYCLWLSIVLSSVYFHTAMLGWVGA